MATNSLGRITNSSASTSRASPVAGAAFLRGNMGRPLLLPTRVNGRAMRPLYRARKLTKLVASAASTTVGQSVFQGTERKYIMISGKGGVGKTSLASSLAVRLASEGHQVLIVSTDPAHSLSDSLAQDVSGGKPVPLEGTELPIWGMEIDPEEAKREFKEYAGSGTGKQQVAEVMGQFGLGALMEQISDLKLGELLDTPPPGLDEAVAISKVVEFVDKQEYARFTRIIFDTAPTGHTLRLLALPEFVDNSLGKIVRLRQKLSGASAAVKGVFGMKDEADPALEKMQKLQESVRMVRTLFRDPSRTEFIIATIPTMLAAQESARLIRALNKEGVPCKRIIVNQVLDDHKTETFLRMKNKDQEKSIHNAEADPELKSLQLIKAPLLDLEVRGLPALQYFGQQVWLKQEGDAWQEMSGDRKQRFFMLGGKGGVGKTSLSSSLAVSFAAEGHNTLVVSTDPAHSLSDSLAQDVSGGKPVPLEGTDLPIYGMEIDIEEARRELKEFGSKDGNKLEDLLRSAGLGGIADQFGDLNLSDLLDNPPPGVDEAVAISKVVKFLREPEYSKFTRIVFDTAPTGHTLRLLTLPEFLDKSIGKIVRLRQKIGQATSAVKNIFSGGKGAQEEDELGKKLETLKARMEEARQLFRDKDRTEFIIVSIPTQMAVAESSRLAHSLRAEGVPVRRAVLNQIVPPEAKQRFIQLKVKDQEHAMDVYKTDAELMKLQRVEAPLFDLEVRGLAALDYFGKQVWKD